MKADIDGIQEAMSIAGRQSSASTGQRPMGGGTTHGPMAGLPHAADAMFEAWQSLKGHHRRPGDRRWDDAVLGISSRKGTPKTPERVMDILRESWGFDGQQWEMDGGE